MQTDLPCLWCLGGVRARFDQRQDGIRLKGGTSPRQDGGGGRPAALDETKLKRARQMMANPETTASEVCEVLKISRTTLYRRLGKGTARKLLDADPAPTTELTHGC